MVAFISASFMCMHLMVTCSLNALLYTSLKWKYSDQVWYQSGSSIDVNCNCMISRENLQRGEGKIKSFDPEVGCAARRGKIVDEDVRLEEEWNYRKAFYTMVEKVDKLFAEYEKIMVKPQKKEGPKDHALVNHEGGGEEPLEPPSPSSSESSSSSSSRHSRDWKTHKNPLFKLHVKFDLLVFSGEYNVEKLDNLIRQVEVYPRIQRIKENEANIQLVSLQLSGTTLVWWEGKLQKGGKSSRKLISFWSEFIFALRWQF